LNSHTYGNPEGSSGGRVKHFVSMYMSAGGDGGILHSQCVFKICILNESFQMSFTEKDSQKGKKYIY